MVAKHKKLHVDVVAGLATNFLYHALSASMRKTADLIISGFWMPIVCMQGGGGTPMANQFYGKGYMPLMKMLALIAFMEGH